jgi:hypothetical protein
LVGAVRTEITIAGLDDAALWDAIQAESGIPSHARSVAAALAAGGIVPRLARVAGGDGRLVIPFFERRHAGRADICTWLSVAGAWCRPPLPPLLAAWNVQAQREGWVASYIQVEPGSDVAGLPEAREGNEVFLLDLAARPPREGFAHRVERHVRRAEKTALRLVEDREVLAEALVRLFPAAMARAGASAAYDLAPATLRALALSPDCLVLGAAPAAEVEIAWVFPAAGAQAENFLQAASPDGRGLAAWLYWQVMERLRARGVRWLNLGGGVRRGDGIAQFKGWLGGVPRPLHALRLVHDEAAYAALCAAAGADPAGRWFPAYRDTSNGGGRRRITLS